MSTELHRDRPTIEREDLHRTEREIVDRYLDRAISEFDANPVAANVIRRLASEMPESFADSAVRHLATRANSNAHRFLSVMMLRYPSLFEEQVVNPKYGSAERAVNLFNRMANLDPAFDLRLARALPDRDGLNHHKAYTGVRAARTLEVLDQTSPGRRLLPILGHLADSNDQRIREKAVLFVGRRVKSPTWAEKQLKHPDDRVRANAIESLWGLSTAPAKTLLENCLADTCNRVRGNALIGLHIAGVRRICEDVEKMSQDPQPHFRSTAAWIMGRISDPQFIPQLTDLSRDEHPQVRSTALRSMIELRRSDAAREAALAEARAAAPQPEPAPIPVDKPVTIPQVQYVRLA